jgi:hypothetical protein
MLFAILAPTRREVADFRLAAAAFPAATGQMRPQ